QDTALLWMLMTVSDGAVAMGELNCLTNFLEEKGLVENEIDNILHYVTVKIENSPGIGIIERIVKNYTYNERISIVRSLKKLAHNDKCFISSEEKLLQDTCSLIGVKEKDI
ncbi:MAG: TerB family tellurite resistance protein, partial [Candidatus Aureabacteria bacterium]|nr:TerB family tellurite resistance protein [Candidatus Auribacterota bacterium]